MTYLFLDTEWADLEGEDLLSLGIVSDDGRLSFYAERRASPRSVTEFVRDNVIPLMGDADSALGDIAFTSALRTFLNAVPHPVVIYDYPNDGVLLQKAIDGLVELWREPDGYPSKPENLRLQLLRDPHVGALIERWFARNPLEAARRHHALADARALREAWLVKYAGAKPCWAIEGATQPPDTL